MSVFSRTIKNLAIVFGIFLAVSIISFCLDGIYAVLEYTDLIHKNDIIDLTSYDIDNYYSYLDINLKASSLIIKKGDTFKYETNIKDLKVTTENNKLIIKDKRKSILKSNNKKITIYVPGDLVFEKVKINIGAGKLDVKNVDLTNIDFDLGIGKVTINSKLTGKNTIDCGIGELNLNLDLIEDNYTFKLDKGIGEITLNGKQVKNDTTIGRGENSLNVDGGIGKIEINTKENR